MVLVGTLDADGTIQIVQRIRVQGSVGAVAVAVDGELLIANSTRLLRCAPKGSPELWVNLLPDDGTRQLNDGAADPAGRFVVGSLSLAGPSQLERLFVVETDGSFHPLDTDLTLSNGLAWTADGRRMYSVDTLRRRIEVRRYDPPSGDTGERALFVELHDGYPDGICLDVEEHLWVAVWGLGQLHRYAPDGSLDRVIDVPAPHTSSLAFAGLDRRTLVITTASDGLSARQLEDFPDSGRLFTIEPGVAGAPRALWAGSDDSQASRKPGRVNRAKTN